MKILLLEDNTALNKAILKVLKLDNHTVDSYTDGQEVLNAITDSYDLYILDINVPHINGLELLDLISTHNSQAKVIMISANTDMYSLQEAYKLGCVDYLKKPFHLEELRVKIDNLKIPRENLISSVALKDNNDSLTKKEKRFLNLLLDNQDVTVTYTMIENYVYENKAMSMDALRALVRRVRAKLADDIIHNVLDEGYTVSQVPLALNVNLEENIKQRVQELERENHKLKLEKKALQEATITDPLTGLYNRVKVEETFLYEQNQSIRYGNDLSMMMIDIDDFKSVNDSLGHNTGDELLKNIAKMLKTLLRDTDIICRWGGEEFLILLPKTNLDKTKELANRVRSDISKHSLIPNINTTISIGVAVHVNQEPLSGLIQRADEALYLAKDQGKNRVEVAASS